MLKAEGVPVRGFVTREIRERGRRVGFSLETVAGVTGTLAHVDLPGPPRVGKYGVDLVDFERVVVPELTDLAGASVVIVDELGKMELASKPFQSAVSALFDASTSLVATVHAFQHPFTDDLKRRQDVELVSVGREERDELPRILAARLI